MEFLRSLLAASLVTIAVMSPTSSQASLGLLPSSMDAMDAAKAHAMSQPKLDSTLLSLVDQSVGAPPLKVSENSLAHVDATGRVQVYVYLTPGNPIPEMSLIANGVTVEVISQDAMIVQGWVPIGQLRALAVCCAYCGPCPRDSQCG